ncbi:MAG: hypothetical protein CVT66_08195 [Actinobacteria bacterium HGW-Actinobacteria-6]|jgi:hypothetical protein|nr:MAG: hypothetical protein CVT66_08195 [Actinobacteria bacterium HGW-Actinobacteria-6]
MKMDRKVLLYSAIGALVIAALIPLFDATLVPAIALLPDLGASWYLWKLPDPTWVTRLSVWAPYIVHQVVVWYLIYRLNASKKRIDDSMSKWNWWLLGVNALFVVAHFAQTALFYDGLAQDVPIWSSQYSVIFMLVMILIMKNRWRGLFFGRKVRLPKDGVRLTSMSHTYYIAWAAIYTFWFHPVVSEWAHVVGFFYMFLLFIQLSLARTRVHSSKYWTLALEVLVLFHGASVAFYTQQSIIWTMFLTGFMTIFIVTQIYGLGLPKWSIRLASAAYLLLSLSLYTFYPSGSLSTERLSQIYQISFIPVTEYALVFVVAAALWAVSLLPPVRAKLHPGGSETVSR